jgi:hypothetical protein
MSGLFALLFLVFLILWPVSIFKPELFKKLLKGTTRKKNALLFGGITLLFFTLTGITAPESTHVTTLAPTPMIEPTKSVQGTEKSVTPTPTSTKTPTPTVKLKPTNTPTVKPTSTPTPKPTIYYPTATPVQIQQSSGSWPCDCSLTCQSDISSCAQAQYLLNVCGCSARDGDHDGIACDGAPLHCQN